MFRFSVNVLVVLLATAVAHPVLGQGAAAPAAPAAPAPAAIGAEAAPLVFWNREVVVFRAPAGRVSPQERAANVAARLALLPLVGEWDVQVQEGQMGDVKGISVTVNGAPVFGLMPEDLDPAAGETLKGAGDRAAGRLREALEARAAQARPGVLAQGLGLSAAATVLLGLVFWGAARLLRRLRRRPGQGAAAAEKPWHIGGINLRPTAMAVQASAVRLLIWAAVLMAIYIWLTFVLNRFPYTEPWGAQLRAFLVDLLATLALGAVKAVPGLFTVLVIAVLARGVVRTCNGLLLGVENGTFTVSWLDPATAKATRRILVTLVFVLALVVAYPYMPGSDTDVFKGVSVFVGLVVTLGATGMVNQFMSGLTAVYSRAFQPGDAVRIGETEGRVVEVGVLSTRLQTWKGERITIPNAVLIGTTITNYSRPGHQPSEVLSTSVTVGYDTPWRQIHALLLLAAERTPRVCKEPRPRVVQRTLDGHAVEYQLAVHADASDNRMAVLSDLHARIQDAFNEFGVQIMAPRFGAQPDRRVGVPPTAWFAPPAAPEAGPPEKGAGQGGANEKP